MLRWPETKWTALAHELGQQFAPRAAACDAGDTFVAENYQALQAAKVFSLGVPQELGGQGASTAELAAFLRVLAHGCSSTALALSMHTHLVATAAWRWRAEKAPVDALLRRVAAEGLVLVSTGGADFLSASAKAERVEGGYRVKGRKIFCSGAPAGKLMATTALLEDPTQGSVLLQMTVPMQQAGVKIQDTWHTLGMRGTGSHDVWLEDVFVPDAAVSMKRPIGKWHPLIHTVVMVAFPLISAVYVGVAEAARGIALEMAGGKKQDRAIQMLAGELENELTIAQLALHRAVEVSMTGTPGPETTAEVMCCRAVLGRATRATLDKAMELAGGGSFFRSATLERLFRDVQGVRFHPLQDKPQSELVGRFALGLPLDA